jgi:hypothetical protein
MLTAEQFAKVHFLMDFEDSQEAGEIEAPKSGE